MILMLIQPGSVPMVLWVDWKLIESEQKWSPFLIASNESAYLAVVTFLVSESISRSGTFNSQSLHIGFLSHRVRVIIIMLYTYIDS